MTEKRYKILEKIMLDFPTPQDQSTEYILPEDNALIIVENKMVYLLCKGKKRETINHHSLIGIYEKEGLIREENSKKAG